MDLQQAGGGRAEKGGRGPAKAWEGGPTNSSPNEANQQCEGTQGDPLEAAPGQESPVN
ncbi:hCG2003557 [Homo sapiens]